MAKFHYLGQVGSTLYFYYPLASPIASPYGGYFEGVIQVSLPFESGNIEIAKSNENEKWAESLEQIGSTDLLPEAFDSLCNGKLMEPRKFAEAFFGKTCP